MAPTLVALEALRGSERLQGPTGAAARKGWTCRLSSPTRAGPGPFGLFVARSPRLGPALAPHTAQAVWGGAGSPQNTPQAHPTCTPLPLGQSAREDGVTSGDRVQVLCSALQRSAWGDGSRGGPGAECSGQPCPVQTTSGLGFSPLDSVVLLWCGQACRFTVTSSAGAPLCGQRSHVGPDWGEQLFGPRVTFNGSIPSTASLSDGHEGEREFHPKTQKLMQTSPRRQACFSARSV